MENYIECLGASSEVGRSAFLLKTDKKIMNDYGVKLFDESGEPKYPIHTHSQIDAVILSHAHMDHSGALPLLYKHSNLRWFGTPPTKDIADILWQDSMKIQAEKSPYSHAHYKKALRNFHPFAYGENRQFGETRVRMMDAGHIAGSAMVEYQYKDKVILYTGDFKIESQEMQHGAKYPKNADILMIESTYARKDHPPRKETEHAFMDELEMTIEEGGNVLLPAFALGRTQELISVIRKYNREIPVFVDGMGRKVADVYLKYGSYIKDVEKFRKQVRSVNMIKSNEDRGKVLDEPSVVVTTAGMLNGGPAMRYLLEMNNKSKVVFTGFCVKDTNGWKLQNQGFVTVDEQDMYVDLPIKYFDFSAHAGRSEILEFIKRTNPEKVILVHGDNPQDFASELSEEYGFDAVSPKVGDKIEIKF